MNVTIKASPIQAHAKMARVRVSVVKIDTVWVNTLRKEFDPTVVLRSLSFSNTSLSAVPADSNSLFIGGELVAA